jgi:hypothetical protein
MTRKEKEAICRVLKEAKRDQDGPDNVVPSAEWMRKRIGRALCEVLAGMDSSFRRDLFMKAADLAPLTIVTPPVSSAAEKRDRMSH